MRPQPKPGNLIAKCSWANWKLAGAQPLGVSGSPESLWISFGHEVEGRGICRQGETGIKRAVGARGVGSFAPLSGFSSTNRLAASQ
eukprot:1154673-Pelagomonas_calceolata.AAC.3